MRNVRNFWVDCAIDGRRNQLSGGPAAKDGGFHITVKMRDEGSSVKALTVWGHVLDDGSLKLEVMKERDVGPSDPVITISTKR